jgi:hypothetical protein
MKRRSATSFPSQTNGNGNGWSLGFEVEGRASPEHKLILHTYVREAGSRFGAANVN